MKAAATKVLAIASAMAAIVAGGVLAAAPAQAAQAGCPTGAACVWGDTMYLTSGSSSRSVGFQQFISNYSGYTYDGSRKASNSASSVYDNGTNKSCKVFFYAGNTYTGPSFFLTPGTGDGYMLDNVGYAPIGFDDKLNSGKFIC